MYVHVSTCICKIFENYTCYSYIIFLIICICLSELEWRNNSANYKLPVVSSIFHDLGSEWGPHYATDGLFQTGENKIFHSEFATNPWMMIDLQEILLISFIRVFNRGNLGR